MTKLAAARSRSALAETIVGDLPPNSSVTGVRFAEAVLATSRPTRVDPVKNK